MVGQLFNDPLPCVTTVILEKIVSERQESDRTDCGVDWMRVVIIFDLKRAYGQVVELVSAHGILQIKAGELGVKHTLIVTLFLDKSSHSGLCLML